MGPYPYGGSTDHGNTVDDQTHIMTWNTLRRLVGSAHFLYVADAKLCTRENRAHIARGEGALPDRFTQDAARGRLVS